MAPSSKAYPLEAVVMPVVNGRTCRRTRILPQQALHALRHALQQLRVHILIAQPVGADFGDLVEQLTRGVFVAYEEARRLQPAR